MANPVNCVMLNLPVQPSEEPPEPGVAMVTIDGVPISNIEYVSITAGAGQFTKVSLIFHGAVGGFVGSIDMGSLRK